MKRLPALLCVGLMWLPPGQADEVDLVAAARSMVEAINARRLDDLDRWVAPNLVRHSGATPGVQVRSLADFKAFLEADYAAVPDSVMEVQLAFGNGQYVALQGRYSGTQSGQMGPFPATGRPFELAYVGILRFESGQVAEMWIEWDNLGVLAQLGHLEPPATPE